MKNCIAPENGKSMAQHEHERSKKKKNMKREGFSILFFHNKLLCIGTVITVDDVIEHSFVYGFTNLSSILKLVPSIM